MIRKARVTEVLQIHKLLEASARKGELLPRSLAELYDTVRDFQVFVDDRAKLLGCCALHPTWEDLGEIRSLVVREENRGGGIGRRLVARCLKDAAQLGVRRVFVLTYNPDFFRRMGFSPIPKARLPHKIWAECIRCVQFPDCTEEALLLDLAYRD